MGRFQKRKAGKAKKLPPRKARRAAYKKVLIVCEGEKTEPNYFNDLRGHYGLNSADVEVCGKSGSDPSSVYSYAKDRYEEEKYDGDPFDRVYCVFDKDRHTNYKKALNQIAQCTPNCTFFAINSVPCFEYWLLLHFQYTTKPYAALSGKSACDQVLSDLRCYMPQYSKEKYDVFSELIEKLEDAMKHAKLSLRNAENSDTDNPSTRVHELVKFLQDIKGGQ